MEATETNVKYPENLYLRETVSESGKSIKHIAKAIGKSRKVVSDTIHGHYKGVNIIPLIEEHLAINTNK